MGKRPLLVFAIAALAVSATGCQNREPIRPGFGEAVRYNMSRHVINPEPRDDPAPDLSGARAAEVLKRYEKGEVEELRIEQTRQIRAAGQR